MKKLLIAAVALSAPSAAYAANTDSEALSLSATVADTCYIDTAIAGTFDFGFQVSADTALLTASAITSTAGSGYCNNANGVISLETTSGGLDIATDVATTGDFAPQNLPYTAVATWDTETATLTTTGDGGAAAVSASDGTANAINAPISVEVTLASQSNPVVAGSYSDTLTVTLDLVP